METKWAIKVPLDKKNSMRIEYQKKNPSRKALLMDHEQLIEFIASKTISAKKRILSLVMEDINEIDFRDHRKLSKHDRVPRSLEESTTPLRYWNVDI